MKTLKIYWTLINPIQKGPTSLIACPTRNNSANFFFSSHQNRYDSPLKFYPACIITYQTHTFPSEQFPIIWRGLTFSKLIGKYAPQALDSGLPDKKIPPNSTFLLLCVGIWRGGMCGKNWLSLFPVTSACHIRPTFY